VNRRHYISAEVIADAARRHRRAETEKVRQHLRDYNRAAEIIFLAWAILVVLGMMMLLLLT